MELVVVILSILLGSIPAAIALTKGRSFARWWLYGAALFVVALPHSLIISKNTEKIERKRLASGEWKKCPFCAEFIKAEAKVCRFCGRDFPMVTREDQLFQKWKDKDNSGGLSTQAVVGIVLAIIFTIATLSGVLSFLE
jgi:heme/copper-type cytochrome/quinol oxidase subunit 4